MHVLGGRNYTVLDLVSVILELNQTYSVLSLVSLHFFPLFSIGGFEESAGRCWIHSVWSGPVCVGTLTYHLSSLLLPSQKFYKGPCKYLQKVSVKVAQLCPTLCDAMDYTVHGILQARMLEWVAFPFSQGYSQHRDQTQVSCISGGFFTS